MKNRVLFLDFLRCSAIFFVIVLHAMTPFITDATYYGKPSWYLCVLQNPINRIGVPIFFMISGFLMLSNPKTENISEFYKRRIPRIVIPLISWNLIYWVMNSVFIGTPLRLSDFFTALINEGSCYHMWFAYTLLGIYLITPFLKRIVNACNDYQLLIFIGIILFPSTIRPILNTIFPFYTYLFPPLMEGYLGYYLIGYFIFKQQLSFKVRMAVYTGGIIGYAVCVLGTLAASSSERIVLPFNGGYSFNHYLCAIAFTVFVRALLDRWDRTHCSKRGYMERLSQLVFGVYWSHVLFLDIFGRLLGKMNTITTTQFLILQIVLTVLSSFALASVIKKIPVLRKLLMM